PVTEPMSLKHLEEVYCHAGHRGLKVLRARLAQGDLPLPEHINTLFQMSVLHMYEGEFKEAGALAAEARTMTEENLAALGRSGGPWLNTLIFLQGMTALRRGETENCVECGCLSSCIFPIQPEAVHQKQEGSAEAVKHFTDYLERVGDDIGVRWLLNVA